MVFEIVFIREKTNITFEACWGKPKIKSRPFREYPRSGGPQKIQTQSSKNEPYCIHKRFLNKKTLWLQSGLFLFILPVLGRPRSRRDYCMYIYICIHIY
jgi:hypothetical protein